jgi:hypothetical protein
LYHSPLERAFVLQTRSGASASKAGIIPFRSYPPFFSHLANAALKGRGTPPAAYAYAHEHALDPSFWGGRLGGFHRCTRNLFSDFEEF